MKSIRRISFYDTFVCAKGACKETCCKAWSIPVDEEARTRFSKEKGMTGLLLKIAVRGKEEPLLNRNRRRCLFLTREGLCALQEKRGAAFLPYTCQVYPRKRVNLGPVAEETLDLSCIEAAKLFLQTPLPLKQVVLQEEVSYGRRGSNTDEQFLKGLLRSRDFLCAVTEDRETDLDAALRTALSCAGTWQDACARNEDPFAQELPEALPDSTLFPLPVTIVNEWVNGCLYADDLKTRLPYLHGLFKLYFARFDKLDERQGQRRLDRLYEHYLSSSFCDMDSYRKYASYVLYRFYTETYEDYSFIRRVLDMTMHVNLLFLFDALRAEEYGKLSVTAKAHTIAVYEKRVFHNERIQKEMYAKWKETGVAMPAYGGML